MASGPFCPAMFQLSPKTFAMLRNCAMDGVIGSGRAWVLAVWSAYGQELNEQRAYLVLQCTFGHILHTRAICSRRNPHTDQSSVALPVAIVLEFRVLVHSGV